MKKRLETAFRGIRHDKTTFSAVDPALYARRFLTFMNERVVQEVTAAEARRLHWAANELATTPSGASGSSDVPNRAAGGVSSGNARGTTAGAARPVRQSQAGNRAQAAASPTAVGRNSDATGGIGRTAANAAGEGEGRPRSIAAPRTLLVG